MSTTIHTSAEDAEDAFYEAVGRADLDALMSVWADDEETVCIHPTGQRLTGVAAIRESWRVIFEHNPRLTVHAKRTVQWKGALLAVHSVIETLYLGDEPTPHGPMLSTNVYQRGADGWRLLSRHTSAAADASSVEISERQGSGPRTLH
jgi:ketosteroid isomerase-like protein